MWRTPQGVHGGVDGERVDQGFVPLEIDDDLGIQALGRLGHPIRAGPGIRRRHEDGTTETLDYLEDALVVRGDDDPIEIQRTSRPIEDVLNEGTAGDIGERLPRQPCGSVSGGEDTDDRQIAPDPKVVVRLKSTCAPDP